MAAIFLSVEHACVFFACGVLVKPCTSIMHTTGPSTRGRDRLYRRVLDSAGNSEVASLQLMCPRRKRLSVFACLHTIRQARRIAFCLPFVELHIHVIESKLYSVAQPATQI